MNAKIAAFERTMLQNTYMHLQKHDLYYYISNTCTKKYDWHCTTHEIQPARVQYCTVVVLTVLL